MGFFSKNYTHPTTHKHTHTSMSSAHAPQNLPADLNESSQQHELADGCDDADTYLSASLTRCLFFLSSQSLSFFWGSLVVHTSDLSLGSDRIAYMGFFVRSRPSARPEDVGFARRETRRASFAALFFGRTTSKSGRCARVLVAVGLFSSALEISLEPGVKGRGSRVPFPQKENGGPTEFDALCKMLLSKQHIK